MSTACEETIDLPLAHVGLSFDSEHRLRSENLSFDIDVWYPNLQSFTFRSVFIPLKRTEAAAIKAFHDVSWRHVRSQLSEHEISILNNLEAEITETIRSAFPSRGKVSSKAFLRLCGRSPKDGEPLDRRTPIRDYLRNIREALGNSPNAAKVSDILETNSLLETNSEYYDRMDDIRCALDSVKDVDVSVKISALSRVSWLHVRDGKDALSLMLTSERVYAEMVDWLKYGEPEQICLREWEPDLQLCNEFRVFVYQGRVTAISQYDHYGYYENLHQMQNLLKSGILEYWTTINPHIRVQNGSYVVDIGYLPSTNSYVLIELSPFSPCTGAALFSWRDDIDILTGKALSGLCAEGQHDALYRDVVFRLKEITDMHPQLDQLVELNWDDRWKESFQPYWAVYLKGRDASVSSVAAIPSFFRSIWSSLFNLNQPNVVDSPNQVAEIDNELLLFVYGTLKSGFQWNGKYLSKRFGAKRLGTAKTTDCIPLVIGDCGVPYLLGDPSLRGKGKRVIGELWSVDPVALKGLDDYEGISKGYYRRTTIGVEVLSAELEGLFTTPIVEAFVYILLDSSLELQEREYRSEYTLNDHMQLYSPILHIQRKQLAYIGTPSTWGKIDNAIEGGLTAPTS